MLAPAIKLAEDGFAVSPLLASDIVAGIEASNAGCSSVATTFAPDCSSMESLPSWP